MDPDRGPQVVTYDVEWADGYAVSGVKKATSDVTALSTICLSGNEHAPPFCDDIKIKKENIDKEVLVIEYEQEKTDEGRNIVDIDTNREVKDEPIEVDSNTVSGETPFCKQVINNHRKEVSKLELAVKIKKMTFYNRNFVCCVCYQFFASPIVLNCHKLVHNKRFFFKNVSQIVQIDKKYQTDSKQVNIKRVGIENVGVNFKISNALKETQNRHLMPKNNQIKCENNEIKSNINGMFECNVCKFESRSYKHVRSHQIIHTWDEMYTCDKCPYKCKLLKELESHTKEVHNSEIILKCDSCKYECRSSNDFESHMVTHTWKNSYRCNCCEYKCQSHKKMILHNNTRHVVKDNGVTIKSEDIKME